MGTEVVAVFVEEDDCAVEGGLAQGGLGEEQRAFETQLGGVFNAHDAGNVIWAG